MGCPRSRFPAKFSGFCALYAPFRVERRTRGPVRHYVQEIRGVSLLRPGAPVIFPRIIQEVLTQTFFVLGNFQPSLRDFSISSRKPRTCVLGFFSRPYGFACLLSDVNYMANVDTAIDYVLGWEDATLSGVITSAPDGKRTRFGIDEHWHPELTNCLYYSSMGQVAALQIARGIYDISYCQPLCIAEIVNQEIANKLLSLGVNVGVVNAARMLQDAVTVVGDGRIGPLTLHALDLADPEKVLADLRQEAESYYEALVKANPDLAVYRAGWLRRATA